jgi:CheY-like chemotaxis protein
MQRIRLIHWHEAESAAKADRLRDAGYDVDYQPADKPEAFHKNLGATPPQAVVIDLSRLPSHGREVALRLRQYKPTRHIPLVFVEGDPEKVARIQQILPDAVYTTWGRIRGSLKRAIARPLQNPRVPAAAREGYSGTPLPKKLGIKNQSRVALVNAPPDFENTLGDLPEGATVTRKKGAPSDLTLWFVRSRQDLQRGIRPVAGAAKAAGLWIIWPKKTSALASDISETDVRETALATGLVDFKVCAVDATWSGLRFSQKKRD